MQTIPQVGLGSVGMSILTVTQTPVLCLSSVLLSACQLYPFRLASPIRLKSLPLVVLLPLSLYLYYSQFQFESFRDMLTGYVWVGCPPLGQWNTAKKVEHYDWQLSCDQWRSSSSPKEGRWCWQHRGENVEKTKQLQPSDLTMSKSNQQCSY